MCGSRLNEGRTLGRALRLEFIAAGDPQRRTRIKRSNGRHRGVTRLGSSGLVVSRLALGCMSLGDKNAGRMTWILNDDEAAPIFRRALELGITFWDTANIYGYGTSEEVVGRAIKEFSRREHIVLATKLFQRMYDGRAAGACPAGPCSSRWTCRCDGSARITSTCCRCTASTPQSPSRRRWKRCTTWSRRARFATWGPRRCGLGSSPRCRRRRARTAGRRSSRCRISTA